MTSKKSSNNKGSKGSQDKTPLSDAEQKSANKKKNPDTSEHIKLPDPIAMYQSMMQACERAQPLIHDYFEKYSQNVEDKALDPFNVRGAYMELFNQWMNDPSQALKMQAEFMQNWAQLWQESMMKFLGEESVDIIKPDPKDRRFRSKDWQESAVFDFIKQSYLLTCQWMTRTIEETRGLNEHDKKKLEFYTQLFANALSPSNFVLTNPDVLNETLNTGGENLVKGLQNLLEDLERGQGELAISTTNYEAFKVGENLAATPGKVVYENELMQLIQYTAQTQEVHETPLLIVPPWINKYYILDLRPETSYIAWAIQQGYTVYVVSWANPDSKLAKKRFEDYMKEGVLSALDHIEKSTKQKSTNVVGYCLGGTLLTITLSYLTAKKQESRIKSATFFTTLIDFEDAGDLKLFMDDAQLELMDRAMAETGVLQAKSLQRTFSLLRANDMIWSFVINNYLMGKEPFPFDLLYWNDDSTNMPAAMHSFYLRKLYRDNLLVVKDGIEMDGVPIDIHTIKTPAYFLSTREDHIAPWHATYRGPLHFAGEAQFTLAASGHTAGVVNHPAKNKYCYWTSNKLPSNSNDWLKDAKEHEGSWWLHWEKWLKKSSGKKIPARKIENPIENAPGRYVLVKS